MMYHVVVDDVVSTDDDDDDDDDDHGDGLESTIIGTVCSACCLCFVCLSLFRIFVWGYLLLECCIQLPSGYLT